jgi:hypothetical protein
MHKHKNYKFFLPESKFAMHKNNENGKDIAAKKFLFVKGKIEKSSSNITHVM